MEQIHFPDVRTTAACLAFPKKKKICLVTNSRFIHLLITIFVDIEIGLMKHPLSKTHLLMAIGFSSSARPAGSSLGEVRHGAMSSSSNNNKKMKAPLSFASSRQGSGGLSQISEDGIPDLTDSIHGAAHHHGRSEENVSTHDHVVRSFSSGGFSIGSWEDSNSIVFSTSTGKSGAHGNDDIIATLSNYESQVYIYMRFIFIFHFSYL